MKMLQKQHNSLQGKTGIVKTQELHGLSYIKAAENELTRRMNRIKTRFLT